MGKFEGLHANVRLFLGISILLVAGARTVEAQTAASKPAAAQGPTAPNAPNLSLAELFRAAAAANQSQATYAADLELAELRRNKADIEAKTDSDRLNAESTYLSALAEYRRANLAYFNEVVDSLFAAATAELDKEISSLRAQTAQEDRKLAQSKYNQGMISEEGLQESELALRSANTDQDLSHWNNEDAREAVQRSVGMEWNARLLPNAPAFKVDGTKADWIESDTTVRRTRTALKISTLKLALLPTNSAGFDRRIQEAEVAKAKIAAQKAESDAGRAYDGILRRLENQRAVLQIRQEEIRLKSIALAETLLRYGRGLVSSNERNTQRISEMTTRKNLLLAQRSYLKTMGEVRSALGADPLGW
jgi:outer membrane protein TolC